MTLTFPVLYDESNYHYDKYHAYYASDEATCDVRRLRFSGWGGMRFCRCEWRV